MRKWMIGLCVTFMAAGLMADVNLDWIPAGTQWLLEVDVQAAGAAKMTELFKDQRSTLAPAVQALAKLDSFKAATGIDVAHDIDSITVYGRAIGDQTGVAIIRGRWDAAKLYAFVAAMRDFTSLVYGDQTILTWVDKQPVHLCLAASDLMVLSSNEGQLMLALDTIAGRQPGTTADAELGGFNKIANRPMLRFLAVGVHAAPQVNAQAAVLKQTDTLQFSIAETPANGTVVLEVRLGMLNDEAAGQVAQMLEGMRAMAQMQHVDKPALGALVNAMKVTTEPMALKVRMPVGLELAKQLKALMAPLPAAAAAAANADDAAAAPPQE